MTFDQALTEQFGERVRKNEPMSKHVNFRIGGPAKWFLDVKSVQELQVVLELTRLHSISWVVLGGGSNSLVSDDGVDGIVLKLAMRHFEIEGTRVRAEAGVMSVQLARETAKAGLDGFTWAISLPGTIGGAVRGNAGCFGGEMKDSVREVRVLRDQEIVTVPSAELAFGYRESAIKHSKDIVLDVLLELTPGDPEQLQQALRSNLEKRTKSQPLHGGSAGCLFKNYDTTEEELQRLSSKLDIPSEMWSARRLSAGWLIDQLDLKGLKIGDAQISDQHGNFVVNLGQATASDVVQLIAVIKTKMRDELGIHLQEEVQYMGFDS